MGRLRACCRLHRFLAPPPAQVPSPGQSLARGSNTATAHVAPFSRLLSSAAAVAPHDTRDSGLGGSAYWAWIRAATESAPAPSPPQEEEDEGPARYTPVKAYFLSTSIDLKSMQAEHGNDIVPPSTRLLNYIALRYSEFPPEIMNIGVKDNRFCYRYVVVFQYGSAVLFNIADHEAEYYLDIIRKHASGWLPEMRKDDYAVVEKPSLTTWMKGGLDYIVLKSLDTDGIRIISSVLGQSIALDHYIRQSMIWLRNSLKLIVSWRKPVTLPCKEKNSFNLWVRPILILRMLSSDLVFLTGQKLLGKMQIMHKF
uniref:DUF155 domain-containing protein n=1 Tax=Zea mays TaxID=4577 RepID=C0PB26_MAIZE|nr:unknown [Zea mays]|eukprot:NP_001168998.1 uncharacterized LOC100382829 [Zea mays]